MIDNERRLEAALRAGPPEEDTYTPPRWPARLPSADMALRPVSRPGVRHGLGGGLARVSGVATAVAASLVLVAVVALVGLAGQRRDVAPDAGAAGPSDASVAAQIAKLGVVNARLVGRASAGHHTVTFSLGQRTGYSRLEDVIATVLWNRARPEEIAIEPLDISRAHARVLGRGSSSVDGVETVQHGFMAVWTTDERVATVELTSGAGHVQRGVVTRPATIFAVDKRFPIDGDWRWRLLDADERLLYQYGGPLP